MIDSLFSVNKVGFLSLRALVIQYVCDPLGSPSKVKTESGTLVLKLINYSYGYKPIGVRHFGQVHVS